MLRVCLSANNNMQICIWKILENICTMFFMTEKVYKDYSSYEQLISIVPCLFKNISINWFTRNTTAVKRSLWGFLFYSLNELSLLLVKLLLLLDLIYSHAIPISGIIYNEYYQEA